MVSGGKHRPGRISGLFCGLLEIALFVCPCARETQNRSGDDGEGDEDGDEDNGEEDEEDEEDEEEDEESDEEDGG